MKSISQISKLCVFAVVGLLVQSGNAMAAVVNCPALPNTLQNAIFAAFPGEVITINGNCAENVFIGADRLTLQGGTPTDGVDGSISVGGATQITFLDMTVKNASGNGISVFQGAAVNLTGVTVKNNSRVGVGVFDNSYVGISGGTITENGRQGVSVFGSSRVVIDGVMITKNIRPGGRTTNGVSVGDGSSARILNSTIKESDGDGLFISNNSMVRIENVTISDNDSRPIGMFDAAMLSAEDSNISSNVADPGPGNSRGVLVNRSSHLRLRGGNTIVNTAPGGGTGISVSSGSFMRQGQTGGRAPDVISSTAARALSVTTNSAADLRDFILAGEILVLRHSVLRLHKETDAENGGTVTGSIDVSRDSAISFSLEEFGSVEVSGSVTCADTESSADFPGQTAADIVGGNGKELKCSGYGPANSKP